MKAICVTLNPALDKYFYLPCLQVGALNRTEEAVAMTAGGKGINVARGLVVAGDEALNLLLAGGETGEILQRLLSKEGQSTLVIKTACSTRICTKIVTPEDYTEINERGGPVTEQETASALTAFENALEETNADCVVLSGSLPVGMDADIYARMMEGAHRKNIPVILDCDGATLQKSICSQPFLIKPNLFELSQLIGKKPKSDEEIRSACWELYQKTGIEIVCTCGASGAVYAGKNGVYTVTSPKVDAKKPSGAGDTFLAGYLSAYFQDQSPSECLIQAVQSTAGKLESQDGFPIRLAKEKYRSQIVCTQY